MPTNQKFPDSVPSPVVNVSRVCISMDAPWDARNDRLTEVLRSSAEKPNTAEAQVRELLEQGININARDGNRWRVLRLAAFFQAPMRIRDMLAYASREGSAAVNTSSDIIARDIHSMNNVSGDRSKCGQCERDVHAIFLCRERSTGHCPFVERGGRNIYIGPTWVVVALAPIALIFGKSTWAGWVALTCLVTAFVLLVITREKLLYNTKSYVWLKRTTVAGVEWVYRWNWEVGMPIRFEPIPPLAYPSSIASISYPPSIFSIPTLSEIRASKAQVVTIFRAALFELLAKQCIEAYLFRGYAVTRMRPTPTVVDTYVVLIERHTKGFENLGALEKRIFLAVRCCSVQRSVQSAPKATEGLHLYDVVRAVYEQDQESSTAR